MAPGSEYPTAGGPGDDAAHSLTSPIGAPSTLAAGAELEASPLPDAAASAAAAAAPTSPTLPTTAEPPKAVVDVLQSEIGIVTLLTRLKHSISSAKEFALFLKKRAQLEEDYSAGMRKLARTTQDAMTRTDSMQGTFGSAFSEMMDIHSRMADNGYQFSMSLHQMHEDLVELAAVAEKNRKGWKQTGLAAEQRVVDLETATRKAKAKYDSLAEEYDRARTGDVSGRRGGFGFKGPKSAAQHEEDLLRKLQSADEVYHGCVDNLSRGRAELLDTNRPETVKALQELVRECDGGMVLQVQKYASFSEKLLLSNGLSISPIKSAQKPDARSLREVVISVDTDRDLNNYIATFHNKVPPKSGDPKYERNPILSSALGQPASTTSAAPPTLPTPTGSRTHTSSQSVSQPTGLAQHPFTDTLASPLTTPSGSGPQYGSLGVAAGRGPQAPASGPPPGSSQKNHERSVSYSSGFGPGSGRPPQGGPTSQAPSQGQPASALQQSLPLRGSAGAPPTNGGMGSLGSSSPDGSHGQSSHGTNASPYGPSGGAPSSRFYNGGGSGAMGPSYPSAQSQGPPQLGALPFQTQPSLPSMSAAPSVGTSLLQSGPPQLQAQSQLPSQLAQAPAPLLQHPAAPMGGLGAGASSKPVFGVPLDVLYERDGLAVPMVVYQCIQAVDLFGLTVEGIYRLSGSLPHVNKLKSMFDTDTTSPKLDFRNPENFFHDVNSVAGLLKQFFRDLPNPLLTREHYDRFIEAAKPDDATVRRDSLHAVINDLPDPNYATLRALVLHLNRVVENASVTRMTSQNLAIVFGPTLMGAGTGDPEKGRWHVRVIDTILQNTYQIFDED